MKKLLEKRLAYLYKGERNAIIVFIVISYFYNFAFPSIQLYSLFSFWTSFLLLEFILLQGTIYWYKKWNRLRKENTSITPIQTVKQLRRLKKINIILIAISLLAFAIDFSKWYPSLPVLGLSIAGFICIFAVLEYINYFHIQLSYDNISDIKYLLKTKRLKQACISKDLNDCR
ncbi:general stress protein [Peribacillus simplex]|uniref:General stress protein n=2 Tax=Peribacillus TaxID=2675229 RepID=A0AA90P4C7_9BACI|nr:MULTISPECIES: general stress protein [Peribacillus]MDP1420318.1 general stress protein [Peribacillus simplex]MDP1453399.1 general stress protein [Peribacillus frigoritolerans]